MNEQELIKDFNIGKTWLQKHTTLIIVILAILSALFLGNKIIDHQANVADKNATIAMQALTDQKEINLKLAAQLKQDTDDYKALFSEMNRRNQMLENAITYRNTELKKQQSVDYTLPLSDLGKRWQTLLQVGISDIKVQDTSLVVSESASRQTVTQLERIPVLEANLSDTEAQLTNQENSNTSCNQLVGNLQTQITGLNSEITKEGTACKADKDKLINDGRKSKIKIAKIAFGAGFVAGFIVRQVTHLPF
jgi:hypothetical protein